MTNLTNSLLDAGLIDSAAMARAEEVRTRAGGRLPATLVRLGLVAEHDLARVLATSNGLRLVGREELATGPITVDGLNHRYLIRNSVFPLTIEDDQLFLAMADPEDDDAAAALAFATERAVSRCVSTFSDIEDALSADLPDPETISLLGDDLSGGAAEDLERLLEGESDAPVIRLVQRLLTNAVRRRASDVHIEPMARHIVVRYRIDGRLIEIDRLADAFASPVASRIKVMAGLDIAESRLPQDGRLRLTVAGRDVDVRVSTSPTAWGESIVLRLLGRTEVPLDLERLGLPDRALQKLFHALDRPHGIILLTGPTGSGKTTTLYAALNRLRRPEVKILTVEDPVEVLLEGVNQVQVRPEIDLSYAATLRAFLRQDPDILMIGEIRDQETAEIALRAALTGHLVLSTLHTNSAAGAFTRLADIGIEPYLTASTVIATIAQRLIRALCPECRRARVSNVQEQEQFRRAELPVPAQVYDPCSCASCQQSGYAGRIPLIEILEVDEAVRVAIREGRAEALASTAPHADTLHGHGLALIAQGRTSFAELERAVQAQ
jgi:general secretion pathway protein E